MIGEEETTNNLRALYACSKICESALIIKRQGFGPCKISARQARAGQEDAKGDSGNNLIFIHQARCFNTDKT